MNADHGITEAECACCWRCGKSTSLCGMAPGRMRGRLQFIAVGVQGIPEDRPLLDELTAYFGNGNRSAYLRAALKVMKSIMTADQLRQAQAYGQQRTAELGIDPADVPARIQAFLKSHHQA